VTSFPVIPTAADTPPHLLAMSSPDVIHASANERNLCEVEVCIDCECGITNVVVLESESTEVGMSDYGLHKIDPMAPIISEEAGVLYSHDSIRGWARVEYRWLHRSSGKSGISHLYLQPGSADIRRDISRLCTYWTREDWHYEPS
jgi:hypothetical protein